MSNYALETIATMLNLCLISNYFVPNGMKDYVRYHMNSSIKRITLRALIHKLRNNTDDDSSCLSLADKLDDLPVVYWYVTTENYLHDVQGIEENSMVYVRNIARTILDEYKYATTEMGVINEHLSLWGDEQ